MKETAFRNQLFINGDFVDARSGETFPTVYAHKSIVSALPNIYEAAQLREFAAASGHEPLTDAEMERVNELYERNFDVVPYVEEAAAAR
jgi:hypothetical protein